MFTVNDPTLTEDDAAQAEQLAPRQLYPLKVLFGKQKNKTTNGLGENCHLFLVKNDQIRVAFIDKPGRLEPKFASPGSSLWGLFTSGIHARIPRRCKVTQARMLSLFAAPESPNQVSLSPPSCAPSFLPYPSLPLAPHHSSHRSSDAVWAAAAAAALSGHTGPTTRPSCTSAPVDKHKPNDDIDPQDTEAKYYLTTCQRAPWLGRSQLPSGKWRLLSRDSGVNCGSRWDAIASPCGTERCKSDQWSTQALLRHLESFLLFMRGPVGDVCKIRWRASARDSFTPYLFIFKPRCVPNKLLAKIEIRVMWPKCKSLF